MDNTNLDQKLWFKAQEPEVHPP